MITEKDALNYIKSTEYRSFLLPEPTFTDLEDVLLCCCIKWDPAIRLEDVGKGNCACCGAFRMDCAECPLGSTEGVVADCCDGEYIAWQDSSTLCYGRDPVAALAVFEFIKAKYKEVSGKDYV